MKNAPQIAGNIYGKLLDNREICENHGNHEIKFGHEANFIQKKKKIFCSDRYQNMPMYESSNNKPNSKKKSFNINEPPY